jgi:acetate kinase
MPREDVLVKGIVERIGLRGSRIVYEQGNHSKVVNKDVVDHREAIKIVIDLFLDTKNGVIKHAEEISAVGHRVAQGGESYKGSTVISDLVVDEIERYIPLAPLHNPANLMGIKVVRELLPNVINVAVFDTAFHQTMPEEAYIYGIPYEYYEKDNVRRYSYHGMSHEFVSKRAAEILALPYESLKMVVCHLGNGSSVAAISNGRSIDASLGLGTTCGVLMGTRCGDIDASVVLYLMEKEKSIEKVSDILHKQSGLLGVSGISSDLRDVEVAAKSGEKRAVLAKNIFFRSIKKYIASYAAIMGGIDVIVFTAGIGENSPTTRSEAVKDLEFMGIKMDTAKNEEIQGKETVISAYDSKVKILVIPTNEELMIARDTIRLALA